MALSTTAAKVILSGNGATTVFPYTFPIPDAASLVVIYTDTAGTDTTLSSSDYSVTGIGGTTGGNVTYNGPGGVPIATGTKLTIARVVDYTQSTVFTNQGGYFPAVTEARFDRTMMAVQQLADSVGRALRAPVSDGPVATLPTAAQRANTVLGFDASGNPTATVLTTSIVGVSPFIANNFLPAANAPAALAVLGGIGVIRSQKFTASGTYTPNPKMVCCIIECLGAGGGGGGTATSAAATACSAGGGGSGSTSRKFALLSDIGGSKAVTIGAAGTAGASGTNTGGTGGDTSVGVLCIGKGGTGGGGCPGIAGSGGSGGAGGVPGTGDDVPMGQPGQSAINLGVAGVIVSAAGGSSPRGAGGGGVPISVNQAAVGAAGTGFGSGGGGAASTNNAGAAAGGAGAPGFVFIAEFCSS